MRISFKRIRANLLFSIYCLLYSINYFLKVYFNKYIHIIIRDNTKKNWIKTKGIIVEEKLKENFGEIELIINSFDSTIIKSL